MALGPHGPTTATGWATFQDRCRTTVQLAGMICTVPRNQKLRYLPPLILCLAPGICCFSSLLFSASLASAVLLSVSICIFLCNGLGLCLLISFLSTLFSPFTCPPTPIHPLYLGSELACCFQQNRAKNFISTKGSEAQESSPSSLTSLFY